MTLEPALRSRLAHAAIAGLAWTAGGIVILALSPVLDGLVSYFLAGTAASVVLILLFLAKLLAIVACFGGAYVGFTEWRRKPMFTISESKIRFDEVVKVYETIVEEVPSEIKFVDREVQLADADRVEVVQDWLDRKLGCGDVHIFAKNKVKPAFVIWGIDNPTRVKEQIESLITTGSFLTSASRPTPTEVRTEDRLRDPATIGKRLNRAALRLAISCCIVFTAMAAVGQWYSRTIPEWDECVRLNRCFVCHRPAFAREGGAEEFGKNIRLCPEHSTGWRPLVYGVPAAVLIYQDAPLGSAPILQPAIRFLLNVIWFGVMLATAFGEVMALTYFLFAPLWLGRLLQKYLFP